MLDNHYLKRTLEMLVMILLLLFLSFFSPFSFSSSSSRLILPRQATQWLCRLSSHWLPLTLWWVFLLKGRIIDMHQGLFSNEVWCLDLERANKDSHLSSAWTRTHKMSSHDLCHPSSLMASTEERAEKRPVVSSQLLLSRWIAGRVLSLW